MRLREGIFDWVKSFGMCVESYALIFMDPITLISQFGSTQAFGNGVSASSISAGGFTQGWMQGQFGSQPFSFTNTPFGMNFMTAGKVFSLRPDFISKLALGQSYSIFSNGQNLGSIGFGSSTGYFSGNLDSNLGSSMAASMMSSGSI